MNGEPNGGGDGGDVKRWLDRALADEPPLSIDRTEILRQGRRRLRNRKLFQAGGTMAAVVAVVLGAVLVTGLITEERSVPPAAEQPANPPGSPTGPTYPPTTSELHDPPSSVEPPTSLETEQQANRLTMALERPGVLPTGYVLDPAVGTKGPTFRVIHPPTVYGLEADLTSPERAGWLWVLVEKGPGVGATCDVVPQPVERCEIREEHGMPMTIARQVYRNGEVRRVVRSVRPDGCFVTVTASNLTSERRDKRLPPWPSAEPTLTEPEMIKIAALRDMYLK